MQATWTFLLMLDLHCHNSISISTCDMHACMLEIDGVLLLELTWSLEGLGRRVLVATFSSTRRRRTGRWGTQSSRNQAETRTTQRHCSRPATGIKAIRCTVRVALYFDDVVPHPISGDHGFMYMGTSTHGLWLFDNKFYLKWFSMYFAHACAATSNLTSILPFTRFCCTCPPFVIKENYMLHVVQVSSRHSYNFCFGSWMERGWGRHYA